MLFELERSVYDILDATIANIIREAVMTGNSNILDRRLPIISVSEDLEEDTLVKASYDTTEKFMYQPTILQLNKNLISRVPEEDLTQVLKDTLYYDDTIVNEDNLTVGESKEFTLTDINTDEEIEVKVDFEEGAIEDYSEDDDDVLMSTEELEELADIAKEELEDTEDNVKKVIEKYNIVKVTKEETEEDKVVTGLLSRYYSQYNPVEDSHKELSKEIVEIIEPSLKGKGRSKRSSYIPDKKLHTRNIVIGNDKEFIHNTMGEGKSTNIVVVLDRSGSMMGKPSTDSSIFINALNTLVNNYPNLKCSIIYSDEDDSAIVHLPISMDSEGISKLIKTTTTHGAEGLAENMDRYVKRIKEAEYVFVYTDGDIVSAPLDKPKYTAWGIQLVGLYTANIDTSKPDEYNRHYDKNKTWFHRVIVSNTVTDLAEHVADYLGE
jgi:uncharacterized protein with von Willebrand factor type A (vWA) domain